MDEMEVTQLAEEMGEERPPANDDAQLILPITEEEREAEQIKRAKKPGPRKTAATDVDDGQGSLF